MAALGTLSGNSAARPRTSPVRRYRPFGSSAQIDPKLMLSRRNPLYAA